MNRNKGVMTMRIGFQPSFTDLRGLHCIFGYKAQFVIANNEKINIRK